MIISKLIGAILGTSPGKRLAQRVIGERADLEEAREVAQKYSHSASEVMLENAMRWREEGVPLERAAREKRLHWPSVTSDISELMLAGGAFLKVVSEFLRERERLQRR